MENLRTTIAAIALCSLAFLITGCATNVGTFPVRSTDKPQYDAMENATIVKNVEAEDSRLWFLCIPLGGTPTVGDAINACLEKGDGDFMLQASLYEKKWTVLLFSYGGYRMIGDVGNSQKPIVEKKQEDIK